MKPLAGQSALVPVQVSSTSHGPAACRHTLPAGFGSHPLHGSQVAQFVYLGQFGGNTHRLDGIVDEVRIYNRALTQAEIQSDMNTPL